MNKENNEDKVFNFQFEGGFCIDAVDVEEALKKAEEYLQAHGLEGIRAGSGDLFLMEVDGKRYKDRKRPLSL